ncbi:hypothetical protein MUK42_05816 [Musa troglodytarum]|uniref:Uncharacterized protein n=1 Tax=Musa troglodytarum TaxID=320322 RepID=A0A9E7KE06_9LILI|nr:hypothetical protein MUK42_05816 [Musa troglodytarum]
MTGRVFRGSTHFRHCALRFNFNPTRYLNRSARLANLVYKTYLPTLILIIHQSKRRTASHDRSGLDEIGVSAACSQDRMHIEKLEGELRNCHQEIENLGPSSAKLAAGTSQDEHVKTEIEKMAKQIHESDLVNQLKEELREVKLKAKEEAEDLTQEMAELRYQFTGMLEEESRRRALVEEASIRRVQDLEAQVQKEQQKSITALRHFQEVNKLAEKQSMEIRRLKTALENILDTEAPKETEALGFVYANNEVDHTLEWHPDEATYDVEKDKNIGFQGPRFPCSNNRDTDENPLARPPSVGPHEVTRWVLVKSPMAWPRKC